TGRGGGKHGFASRTMSRRAVQKLVAGYVRQLRLDPNVSVHSLRVTALTTARERGSDIIDLQDFAGHADPRTTLTYIRSRDRLSKSTAYVLKYEIHAESDKNASIPTEYNQELTTGSI